MNFLKSSLSKGKKFTFTINKIRNPTAIGSEYEIQFEIIDSTGGAIDIGTYTIPSSSIVIG